MMAHGSPDSAILLWEAEPDGPLLRWKLQSRPVEGTAMHRVNEFRFYRLGQNLAALKNINQDTPKNKACWNMNSARNSLDALLNDPLHLRICRSAAQKLIAAIDALLPRDVNAIIEGAGASNDRIGFSYYSVEMALKELEPVLAAECETLDTYVVAKKGIYNTPDLIAAAEKMLPSRILLIVPAGVLYDIKEAGRCLAFDLATACGFHLIRATETVIHEYYVKVTGHTPRRKDRNWGAYVRNLKVHKRDNATSKVDLKLVSLIDQIREHHRNVLMHPEESLSPEEALGLFGICQSAITAFTDGASRI
jgi:hypothetical protein